MPASSIDFVSVSAIFRLNYETEMCFIFFFGFPFYINNIIYNLFVDMYLYVVNGYPLIKMKEASTV